MMDIYKWKHCIMMVMIPERLRAETDEEYEMFIEYLGEGIPNIGRSFAKVARRYSCSEGFVADIARRHSWSNRAADFDVLYVKERAAERRKARVRDVQDDPQSNLESAIALSILSKAGAELNNAGDDESLDAALRLLACYQALKQKG